MSQKQEKQVHFFYSHDEAEQNGCFVAKTTDGDSFTYTSSFTRENDGYNSRWTDSELVTSIEPSKIIERKFHSLSDINAMDYETQLKSGYKLPSMNDVFDEMDKINKEPLLEHTADVRDSFLTSSGKISDKAMLAKINDTIQNQDALSEVVNSGSFNRNAFQKARETLMTQTHLENDKPKNKF
jgi:hypothetical protein